MQFDRRYSVALDMAKGILIACIVVAHNKILAQAIPGFHAFFYNWHVYAFLLIPFLFPVGGDRPGFLANRVVRYLVPFLLFTLLAWCMTIVFRPGGGALSLRGLADLVIALLVGSADTLDRAAGARLFWFLPTLLGLLIVRWLCSGAGRGRAPASLIWIVAVAGFLLAGLIPRAVAQYIPLGLPIALYMLLPGLIFARLFLWTLAGTAGRRMFMLVVSSGIFGLSWLISLQLGTSLSVDLFRYYSIAQPLPLLVHAVLGLAATIAVLTGVTLLPDVRALAWFGNYSLVVYLIHQFIYTPLDMATRRLVPQMLDEHAILLGVVTFALTLALCTLVCLVVARSVWLKSLIIPRDWADWRSAFGFVPRAAARR